MKKTKEERIEEMKNRMSVEVVNLTTKKQICTSCLRPIK